MKTKIIVRGTSTDCKKTKVTLLFEDGKLLNPRSLAASSLVGWGTWQSSAKVNTKWGPAWYVSTAGHGGYILVSQTQDTPFGEPAITVVSHENNVYVYEFEEDCNWAILELFDEGVRHWRQLRRPTQLAADQYLETVKDTVRRWAPEYWEKYEQERRRAL